MRQHSCFLLFLGTLLSALLVQAQSEFNLISDLKEQLKTSRADTNRAKLLLELGRSYIMKPGEQATDLDTALGLIRHAHALSRFLGYEKGQGNAYLVGAQAFREKGNTAQARKFGQTAINQFTKNRNLAELAAAHMELGNTYNNSKGELVEKIRQYEAALPLFHQVGYREREATTLKQLADFNKILSNNSLAIQQLKQALRIYQSIHYSDLQGVYDLLGDVNGQIGNYNEALKYGLLAVKTAELRKDTTLQLCTIYYRLAETYMYLKNHREAVHYFQKSFAIAQRHNDLNSILDVGFYLTETYMALKNYPESLALLKKMVKRYPMNALSSRIMSNYIFLDIYIRMHQYRLAQFHCDQLLKIRSELKNEDYGYLTNINIRIIKFYLATQQYRLARPLVIANDALCRRNNLDYAMGKNQKYWYQLDSAQANYRSAFDHYRLYKAFEDSLSNGSKTKEIAKLQVEYETEQKEQQLQLNKKDIQLLTNKNQAQLTIQKFTIAGVVMITLLLGLTYNRYRLKQRNNRQLEAKQLLIDQKNQSLQQVLTEKDSLLEEKEWLLKEIHHRVKNNLQIITSLLHSQSIYLKDEVAVSAIRESQNRVHTMALIHQKLYQSDRLAAIPMDEYIVEIIDYLISSFDREDTVKKQIAIESINLDISLAVPMGLIINEAITNSLKYAFPESKTGTLIVELDRLDGEHYQLLIADDGVGLPPDFDPTKIQSLGMNLIRGLSKQLGGTLKITQHNGLHINLTFREEKIGR